MKTIPDYLDIAFEWARKDFMRHSMLGIEMIVRAINMLYDWRV